MGPAKFLSFKLEEKKCFKKLSSLIKKFAMDSKISSQTKS